MTTIFLLVVVSVLVVLAIVAVLVIRRQRLEIIKMHQGWTETRHALDLSQQDLANWQRTHRYTELDIKNVEKRSREDSRKRSRSAVEGFAAERLTPYFPELLERFNPSDYRHLGSPLDWIIFDGLSERRPTIRIVFADTKFGKSGLNDQERRVKAAVDAGRVEFEVINLGRGMPLVLETDADTSTPLAVEVFNWTESGPGRGATPPTTSALPSGGHPGPPGAFYEWVSDPIPAPPSRRGRKPHDPFEE